MAGLLTVVGCSAPSEQAAFEEVLATFSIEKAESFLADYPDGDYADQLISHLADWCAEETDTELRFALVSSIPTTHARYAEIRDDCGIALGSQPTVGRVDKSGLSMDDAKGPL